jgi:hypothetical protein
MKFKLAFILAFCATVWAGQPPQRKITIEQAKDLVMASLNAKQRRLPKVEPDFADSEESTSSRFRLSTVVWQGKPEGSVVVGTYWVDLYTGDIFSGRLSCEEKSNKRLRIVQAKVRAELHLSELEYRKLKTKGPFCEQ